MQLAGADRHKLDFAKKLLAMKIASFCVSAYHQILFFSPDAGCDVVKKACWIARPEFGGLCIECFHYSIIVLDCFISRKLLLPEKVSDAEPKLGNLAAIEMSRTLCLHKNKCDIEISNCVQVIINLSWISHEIVVHDHTNRIDTCVASIPSY